MSNKKDVKNLVPSISKAIDEILNPDMENKQYGFCLLVYPFHDKEGHVDFITNTTKEGVYDVIKKQAEVLEHLIKNPQNDKSKLN